MTHNGGHTVFTCKPIYIFMPFEKKIGIVSGNPVSRWAVIKIKI
jgi:hypothetical protein